MAAGGNVQVVVRAMRAHVVRAVQQVVLDVVANLVAAPSEGGTPVDTGHARANWVPSVGSPFAGVAGAPTSVSRGAQEQGVARVVGYSLEAGDVFVSNNVPYIQRLNAGHSKQAPAGFVERAIERAVRGLR